MLPIWSLKLANLLGDNFSFNVHLKVPFLTLLIIVPRRVCEDRSFHSGLEPSQQLRNAYCSPINRTIITITCVVVGNCIRYKIVFPWLIICAAITRRAKLHYETITNVKAFTACASIASHRLRDLIVCSDLT